MNTELKSKLEFSKYAIPDIPIQNILCLGDNGMDMNALIQECFSCNNVSIVKDIDTLPDYSDCSYDLVISIDTINNWVDPEWVFSEVERICKLRGCFVMVFDLRLSKRIGPNIDGMMCPEGKISYNQVSIRESLRKRDRTLHEENGWSGSIVFEPHIYEDWVCVHAWKGPRYQDDYSGILSDRCKRLSEYGKQYIVQVSAMQESLT